MKMLLLIFFLLLFGVILFYSILIFILCKLCLVVFIASKDMGLSENVLLFLKSFYFVFNLRHNTPTLAILSVPVLQTANPRQKFRSNTLK